jgi:DNA invertase Pin-like site-specific DNA recombinase
MNKTNLPEVWDALGYVRASRYDHGKNGNDRDESNTITNQKSLILDFAERNPDIRLVDILADDGATGANFDRTAFKDMIDHIESGAVNCVVVKDFSRLGRDHIEMGKYMGRYFASKNVRFIAINEPYDSLYSDMDDRNNSLIVPFKHIVNESFLEDISIKTKSNLAIKRKNGEFVCNYAVFGYKKSPDKKLVVDDYAAEVVKAIFEHKLLGYNEQQIADMLNAKSIHSPAEYKKASGEKYKTPFAVKEKSAWTPNAIRRILTNRVYIGHLEQGKRTKTSYRMKKLYYKPREDWSVHENNHEPIIDPLDFEVVQELMAMDTRIMPGSGMINTFSGIVLCAHCGRPMTVKTFKKPSGKSYVYYICSTHKKYGTCQNNSVSALAIEQFTLMSIQQQVARLIGADGITGSESLANFKSRKQAAVESMIERNMQTVRENRDLLVKSYEHFVEGIITDAEYQMFRAAFNSNASEAENNIAALREELNLIGDDKRGMELVERFKEYGNITELNRRTVVTLIKSITVYGGKEFGITFRCNAELDETDCGSESEVG